MIFKKKRSNNYNQETTRYNNLEPVVFRLERVDHIFGVDHILGASCSGGVGIGSSYLATATCIQCHDLHNCVTIFTKILVIQSIYLIAA